MEEGFLNDLVTLLSSRKEATVFCVVKSEGGLELVMNTGDMVVQLGMLEVAKLEVIERHARYREEHEEERRRSGARAMAVLGTSGKAN